MLLLSVMDSQRHRSGQVVMVPHKKKVVQRKTQPREGQPIVKPTSRRPRYRSNIRGVVCAGTEGEHGKVSNSNSVPPTSTPQSVCSSDFLDDDAVAILKRHTVPAVNSSPLFVQGSDI